MKDAPDHRRRAMVNAAAQRSAAAQEKTEKIAQVAARGAAIAAPLGQQAQAVSAFLSHYFRHVDAADIDERSVEDLLGLVESHYRLAMHRPASRATVAIRSPS